MELTSNNRIIKNKINKINKRNNDDKGMQTLLPQPPFRNRSKRKRNKNKNKKNENNNNNENEKIVQYSDSDDDMNENNKNMDDGRKKQLPTTDDEDNGNNDDKKEKEEKDEKEDDETKIDIDAECQRAEFARDGAWDINGKLVPYIGKARYFYGKKKTHWNDEKKKQQQRRKQNDNYERNKNKNDENNNNQQQQPNVIRGVNKVVQNEPEYKNEEMNKRVKNIVEKFHIHKYIKKKKEDIKNKYDKDRFGNPFEIIPGKYIIKNYVVYNEEELKMDGYNIANAFWDHNYYNNPFRKVLLDEWEIKRSGGEVIMNVRNDIFDELMDKKENEQWNEFKLIIKDKENKKETQECMVEWIPSKCTYPPQRMVLVDVPRWCNRMDRLKELIINGIKKKMRNTILMNGLEYIINKDNKYKNLYNILVDILKDNDGITIHFPPDMVASDKLLQNIENEYYDAIKRLNGMDPTKIITKIDRLYDNEMINPTKLRMVGLIIEGVPLQYLKNIKVPIGTEYAMLQDSSVLSDVVKFLVDIPQCTHCWSIGHKWKWCKSRQHEINENRKNVDKLYNEKKMQKKERNIRWNKPPERYCKKCNKRGHNGRDCKSKNRKCGICSGQHESIKCAKCPVIKKLIKLYQKAVVMRDDGVSIENIKKINNYNILKYVSGGNKLHQQQLSQSMSVSTVDRGGTDSNNNNKKEENKDDSDDNVLSLQTNHNSSANNTMVSTSPFIPTSQTQIPSQAAQGILNAVQHGNNKEMDQHFDQQFDDDTIRNRRASINGPPIKKHKANNANNTY